MELIALSVLCSVAVSVLLKLAPRFSWDIKHMIAGGYFVAALCCWLLFNPNPQLVLTQASPSIWALLLGLGVLLPSLFVAIALSVTHMGIVLTDAAQRLSLLLPLLAAFLFFNETVTGLKVFGLAVGLFAMLLIVWRSKATTTKASAWHWPLIVFFGIGLVDILFKQLALMTQLPFTDILFVVFVLAFILFAGYLMLMQKHEQQYWHKRNLLAALLLGSLNFGNIVFYIQAHQRLASEPALVFASMNIGVIVFGTLVGVIGFNERLSRLNLAGIGLAVLAIGLLTLARA